MFVTAAGARPRATAGALLRELERRAAAPAIARVRLLTTEVLPRRSRCTRPRATTSSSASHHGRDRPVEIWLEKALYS